MNFSDMRVGDVETLTFDYRRSLPKGATIVAAVAAPMAYAGVDPNPGARVVGQPIVDGSAVTIQFAATIPNVSYWPYVTAQFSDGQYVTLPDPGQGSLSVAP